MFYVVVVIVITIIIYCLLKYNYVQNTIGGSPVPKRAFTRQAETRRAVDSIERNSYYSPVIFCHFFFFHQKHTRSNDILTVGRGTTGYCSLWSFSWGYTLHITLHYCKDYDFRVGTATTY